MAVPEVAGVTGKHLPIVGVGRFVEMLGRALGATRSGAAFCRKRICAPMAAGLAASPIPCPLSGGGGGARERRQAARVLPFACCPALDFAASRALEAGRLEAKPCDLRLSRYPPTLRRRTRTI